MSAALNPANCDRLCRVVTGNRAGSRRCHCNRAFAALDPVDSWDTITAGNVVPVALVILYFAFTVLTGLTESIREGLLTVFGQRITHALRSSMMENRHEPDGRGTDETGARDHRIPVRGRCGYGGEPVYLRNHQHVRRCL